MISVVIPAYNHWDMTNRRLAELYKFENGNIDEVLVMDNGSTEQNFGIRTPIIQHENIRIAENIGFLRVSNMGLKTARGDIKVLLSNDVEISGRFIDSIKLYADENTLIGGTLYNRSTGWNEFNGRIFPYLEGWLLAATAEVWEKLGYFDERFAPNDYEDVDLSTTAVSKGIELVSLNNPALHHIGGATMPYNQERMKQTLRNKQKFMEKWL